MTSLILTRASVSRPSGQRREDDYDVLENGKVAGRIFFLDAVAPEGRPWMWASGHNGEIKRAAHGYAETREAAVAAFASWLLSPQPPLRIQLARRAGLRRRPEHPNVHPVPTGAPVARLAPRHRPERPRRLHEVAHTTRHLRHPPRPRRLPFQARRLRGPTGIDRSKLRHVALHQ